jgi:predicted transcriptional regulator
MDRPISQTQERIREQILDVMDAYGVSRSEIARTAGLYGDAVTAILEGRTRARLDTLARLDAALDEIAAAHAPTSTIQEEHNRRALDAWNARRRQRAARSRVGTIR